MASEADVIAATREWVEKAVIGLNLCPFARSVWVKNQVRIVVSTARHVDGLLDDLDRELALLASTPAEEIELLLDQKDAGVLTRDEVRKILNLPPLTAAQKAELDAPVNPPAPRRERPIPLPRTA